MPSLSRFLCCGKSKPTTKPTRRSSITTKHDDVLNPLLSKHVHDEREAKILQLEKQIKCTATNGEEMERLRQELQQIRMEKDLMDHTATELRQEWSRDKERLVVIHRERDELSQICMVSVAKIAELQVQMETNKNLLLVLQEERTRMQEQILADEIARNQSSSGEKAFDDAVDQLLHDLMTAKQEAQATATNLADRIKMDEQDILMLRTQLTCLNEAKDTAEARVVELEAALDAELQAHETVLLQTHNTHQNELQERIYSYQEEILEMRTQVSNIRASKLVADRCISDLETELNRARYDGDLGRIHIKELEAKIAWYESTATTTTTTEKMLEQEPTSTPLSKTIDEDGTMTPTPWTVTSINSTGSDATDIMTPAGKQAPLSHIKPHGIPILIQQNHQHHHNNMTPKKSMGESPKDFPLSLHVQFDDMKNYQYLSPQKMRMMNPSSSSPSLMKNKGDHVSSEMDELISKNEMTEMQLESVIARLEGQIVALEGDVTKEMMQNHQYTQQMNRLQSDYEARISDLENRLVLSLDDNANLQKFLVEITEAMEKTSQQSPLMVMLHGGSGGEGN